MKNLICTVRLIAAIIDDEFPVKFHKELAGRQRVVRNGQMTE